MCCAAIPRSARIWRPQDLVGLAPVCHAHHLDGGHLSKAQLDLLRGSLRHMSWGSRGSAGRPATPKIESGQNQFFWVEYKDTERQRRDAAQAALAARQTMRREQREVGHAPLDTGELESLLKGKESNTEASSVAGPVHRDSTEQEEWIHEMQPRPTMAEALEAAGLPSDPTPAFDKLLRCQSAGSVLSHCASVVAEAKSGDAATVFSMLAELAIALQLLGRLATGLQKSQLFRDKRLAELLDTLGSGANSLEPWSLISTIQGLVTLGGVHACASAVLKAIAQRLSEFSIEQASQTLCILARGKELSGLRATAKLQEALVAMLQQRCEELAPQTAAALVPALVQLRLADRSFLTSIARCIGCDASTLKVHEIAAASAGLVALRVIHPPVREKAEKTLQTHIHSCTPRAVVQFSVALSEAGDPENFRDYLMPAARSFVYDFSPRDLCILAESFCKVRVVDADFLGDLAHSLQPKVGTMGAHEISVALNVFAPVAYIAPQLLPAVAGHARSLVEELSPRQLARTVRGLIASGCGDAVLFTALSHRAIQLSLSLYGTHAVDMLLAFVESGHLNSALFDVLIGAISRNLDRMPAFDYIVVLYTISRLPDDFQAQIPAGFIDECLTALHARGYGPWRMELEAIVHLLEALSGLQREDETLLELVCDRLPIALRNAEGSLALLVKTMEVLGELPPRSRLQVRTHLHRRNRLRSSLKQCLARHLGRNLDIESQVAMASACANLGYEDHVTQDWLDRLVALAEPHLKTMPPAVTCELCSALAELSWKIDWNRRCVRAFLQQRYPNWVPRIALPGSSSLEESSHVEDSKDERYDLADNGMPGEQRVELDITPGVAAVSADMLLRLAWALAVLDEEVPVALLEELYMCYRGQLPMDWCGKGLRMLQSVALHQELATRTALDVSESLRPELMDWLKLALEVPRDDLYAPHQPPRAERRRKRVGMTQYAHEQWLTVALSQLRIPHRAGAIIGVHRAAVTFPQQKHVIDVLALEDLSAPSGRTLGSAELRRRQFIKLGWVVHSVSLRDLYDAVSNRSIRLLVSKLLSSFDPAAARNTSFRKSVVLGSKPPQMRVHAGRRPQVGKLREEVSAEDEDVEDFEGTVGSSLRPRDPRGILHERALLAASATLFLGA